jgi:hypothetical protein
VIKQFRNGKPPVTYSTVACPGYVLSSGNAYWSYTCYHKTRPKNNRAIPIEMIDERISYDVKRYIDYLQKHAILLLNHLA